MTSITASRQSLPMCQRLWASSTSRSTRHFSSTPIQHAKPKAGTVLRDMRVTLIRQHIFHPQTPRPLRLSRNRSLRHWTIARAWSIFRAKRAAQQSLELARQYGAMRSACEKLRLLGDDGVVGGLNVSVPETASGTTSGSASGRLYRQCMKKEGTWAGVPIESARMLRDWPSKQGWDHGWKSR